MKPITVADLPERPDPGVFLYCRRCQGEFSATRGDYFMAEPDQPMRCCVPLMLARRESRIVEVQP